MPAIVQTKCHTQPSTAVIISQNYNPNIHFTT